MIIHVDDKFSASLGALTRVNIAYESNQIPTANVTMVAGTKGGTGSSPAAPANRTPTTLTWEGETLFEGDTVGASMMRGAKAGTDVGIVHWCYSLQSLSPYSSDMIPSSVWDVDAPIMYADGVSTAEAAIGSTGDLKAGIFKLYGMVAAKDRKPAGSSGSGNPAATAALDRFEASLSIPKTTVRIIQEQAAQLIGRELMDLYNGGTLWDSLIKLGGYFLFSIEPSTAGVRLAPYMPVLPTGKGVQLSLRDIVSVETSLTASNTVGGVALVDTARQISGGAGRLAPEPFKVEYRAKDGPLRPITMPEWLSLERAENLLDPKEVDITRFRNRGTIVNPATSEGDEPAPKSDKGKSLENIQKERLRLGERLAVYYYYRYAYEGNGAVIHGKFRTDIGPGTVVEFNAPDEKRKGEAYCGCVRRVEFLLDADNHHAETALHLSHVRPASDTVEAVGHPFYD